MRTIGEGSFIFGAGAHGRVIADILLSQGRLAAGFLDDNQGLHGQVIVGIPVVGGREWLRESGPGQVPGLIVALGEAPLRLRLSDQFRQIGFALINAIHPSAVVSPSAVLEVGVCICAGAVVNPGAFVGRAVIINTCTSVDHDCRVEDGAHLSPGVHLAGRVSVGRLSFLGTGVSVAPRVRIGSNTIVGAGAAVIGDLPDGVLAVGVPARVVRSLAQPVDWSRLL